MSQPAEASASSDAPTREEEQPEPLTFTLQIVSPNSGPLSFPRLPVTTTVKELKAKIRDAVPSKPIDEHQRLIYRGRMVGSENATMMEVFGQDAIATREPQNLHLVLRPTASDAATSQTSTPPTVSTPQPRPPTIPHPPIAPQLLNRPQSTPAVAVAAPAVPGMQAQQPLPGFLQMQQHQAMHQIEQMQNVMAQRLQQLQRETQRLHQEMGMLEMRTQGRPAPALFSGPQAPLGQNPMVHQPGLFRMPPIPPHIPQTLQNLINQQQRDRALEGRHGAQDAVGNASHSHPAPQTSSGRASPSMHRPDHTTTYTREGVGPNGERFHITVNETTTTLPMPQLHHHHHHPGQHANPTLDVQAFLRNADRLMATRGAQNNMQRSASNPIPAQRTATTSAPSITRPGTPASRATPATTNNAPSISVTVNATQSADTQSVGSSTANSSDSTVYILSSPSGPRALLVNNNETFFTPRQSRRHHSPAAAQNQLFRAPVGLPEFRNRPAGRVARRHLRRANENPLEPANAAHANPGAGALAAQVGPMLWLIVRLVGFVWFFTSGNPSWTRWLMVSGLAFLVFLFNTGIFNGAAEQIFGPVRRHLEGLIPLGPAVVPEGRPAPGEGQDPNAEMVIQRVGRRAEPDPAQVAARLLEQRRQADRGWLMAQFRRAEHSLLLFLASLVPGVGERHIAAREAEANAAETERQRQIEASNAPENAENTDSNNGETTTASAENAAENGGNEGHQPEAAAAPAQPLIEV